MKNFNKLVNFSIKGIVPESSDLVGYLQYLANKLLDVSHLERYRHLNYSGIDFEFLHKSFQSRYEMLEDAYDMVSEYIRKLGYTVAPYSNSNMEVDGNQLVTLPDCIRESVKDMEIVLNSIYTVLNEIRENLDNMTQIQLSGLESDFTALISKLDQSNWLLNSRINDSNVSNELSENEFKTIEEPKSMVHVVNEDIQYPINVKSEIEPDPVASTMTDQSTNESTDVDPLDAKEPEPDHASLFTRLYQKLKGYGRRF